MINKKNNKAGIISLNKVQITAEIGKETQDVVEMIADETMKKHFKRPWNEQHQEILSLSETGQILLFKANIVTFGRRLGHLHPYAPSYLCLGHWGGSKSPSIQSFVPFPAR